MLTLSVTEELDGFGSALELKKTLDALTTDVILDCSELSFIDSRSVAMLMGTDQRLQRFGNRLRMTGLSRFHRKILGILGASDLVEDIRAVA